MNFSSSYRNDIMPFLKSQDVNEVASNTVVIFNFLTETTVIQILGGRHLINLINSFNFTNDWYFTTVIKIKINVLNNKITSFK